MAGMVDTVLASFDRLSVSGSFLPKDPALPKCLASQALWEAWTHHLSHANNVLALPQGLERARAEGVSRSREFSEVHAQYGI